jgi:hypothetical protein
MVLADIESELTFNLHVKTVGSRPTVPLTIELLTSVIVSLGYETDGVVWDEELLCFKGCVHKHDEPTADFWWLVVRDVTSEDTEESERLLIEMRWIMDIEDTSEGATFEEVTEYYDFAKKTVRAIRTSLAHL